MKHHKVRMYMEIGCFVSCLSGWILICSTLVIEYWVIAESASVVLHSGNFYSNLWMDCISDSTGVSDCKYYASMMDLSVFLHVSRALAILSVIFGFWANVLALIGMKCTKIGGSELVNAKITFAASVTYMASGFCGLIVYSWWGDKIRYEFVDQYFLDIKYEFGAALFIGWGGSSLLICGSGIMGYFTAKGSFVQRSRGARKPPTYMTVRSRRSYTLPASSRPTTVIVPSSHLYSGSRGSRISRGRRDEESPSPWTIMSMPQTDSAV